VTEPTPAPDRVVAPCFPRAVYASRSSESEVDQRDGRTQSRHIAMLVSNISRGGIAQAMLSIARGFARRGWRVSIITLDPPHVEMELAPIHVEYLNRERTSTAFLPTCRALRRLRPNVLVGGGAQMNILGLAAARLTFSSIEVVFTEHNMLHWLMKEAPSFKLRIVDLLRKILYRFADHIVVVALGHLIEPKGFHILIDAFSKLPESRSARLVIFGEGNQRNRLEVQVEDADLAGRVSLAGTVQNPYAEIAAADLLVSASVVEAAPLTVCEALCLGVPVVAADAEGGVAEILGQGRFGRLVPINNVAALAQAMEEALSDSETKIESEATFAFSENAVMDQWERMLEVTLRM